MCRIIIKLTAILMLLLAGVATAGQGIWQDATPPATSLNSGIRHFAADHTALRNQLALAPQESHGDRSHTIQLPMPDGSLQRFAIVESSIMESALAAQYPEIKTFKVYGVDDPTASGRADITPQGFHAMLRTSRGRLFVDPVDISGLYQSRYPSGQPGQQFTCGVHRIESSLADQPEFLQMSANRLPGSFLTYRLAVSATMEYVTVVGGTVAAQNQIVTAINRVNEIYESDLGIRLILVANDGRLIDNGPTATLSNDNVSALLTQNQEWIDNIIGTAAYDIGHAFSTGGGGAAFLGAACNSSIKAKGASGQGTPFGDPFYIDYVAHEIGHQLNAEHSFNSTTNSCGSGRNSASAFEPGSGSTVMAYAGICGSETLQMNSDATFHAGSIEEIDSFTKGAGSCFNIASTEPRAGNNDPEITAIAITNKSIPANTPFVLDGTASDIDPTVMSPTPASPDTLLYQWDQMDAGCPTDPTSFGTDNGSNALFRSYLPRGESWRNFPTLGTQVQGRFDKAEVLPCQNRDLDFRLTVRDGNSGQDAADLRVSVTNAAGPFAITNLTAPQTLTSGNAFTVDWDVAGTDLAPINCANVDIDLLTFASAYTSYSIYNLATMIPNIGSASVTINPIDSAHPQARIRVKCNGNIFYDISDVDLIVAEASGQTPNSLGDTDFTTRFFQNVFITDAVAPACGPVAVCTSPPAVTSGGKSGGSGAVDYLWLLMMTGIVALVKLYRRYGLQ